MSATITIKFCVPAGHQAGDYARLHGNGGAGDIDWDTPVNNKIYRLFPDGAGIYGYGVAPYGSHPYGHSFSMLTGGYGCLPYGHHPYGHGTAVITAVCRVDSCGDYKFGFKCYDKFGNVLPFTDYPDYQVTGTLTPDSAGDYFDDGEYNGKPSCRRDDNAWFIWGDHIVLDYGDYQVLGTLTPDSSGDYDDDGVYNGKSSLKRKDDGWYVFWEPGFNCWLISPEKGVWPVDGQCWYREDAEMEGEYVPDIGASGTATVAAGPPDEEYDIFYISGEKGVTGSQYWQREDSVLVGDYAPGEGVSGTATVAAGPPDENPEEVEVEVHTAPPAPAGLKKNSYNKETDILVLDVAE